MPSKVAVVPMQTSSRVCHSEACATYGTQITHATNESNKVCDHASACRDAHSVIALPAVAPDGHLHSGITHFTTKMPQDCMQLRPASVCNYPGYYPYCGTAKTPQEYLPMRPRGPC